MELNLLIRQLIRYDKSGTKQQYVKLQNSRLLTVTGTLPQHRRFPNYGNFLDVTDHVSDLFKLKLTWTIERNEQGLPSVGTVYQRKAASGTLVFEGDAYKYLKAWLVDDESALVNAVEVEIKHVNCGDYKNWVIKATDLSWCEDEICTFNVSLKQKDEPLTCIKNTLITDDWQGWFGNTRRPSSGRRHPRFSYCNEMRPNGKLITIWWTITQLMSILGPLMLVLAPIVNSIVFTLKNIIYPIINLILGILGKKKLDKDKLNYINYKDIKDIFGNFFIESAGCGREHPAPLIRDYIQNVCSKCGISVTSNSVPIFFAQTITLETSADRYNGVVPEPRSNPHYNACYFHPTVDKGVRRFDDLNIFSGAVLNTTDWWLPGNAPLLTLDMFLDQLKTLYNSEWRVENNMLYFQRKDYWLNNNDAFDFSDNGRDRNLLVKGLCYEWNETKEPLYSKGAYNTDAADVCGNGAMNQMNGYVSFGNIDVNPQLDGELDKTSKFGATKFRLDGADTDYVFDAMQQVINTTLITGSVWTTPMFATVNGFFRDYANYALLLTSETVTLPKILIWDGQRYENARCVTPYQASINLGGPAPNPNLMYNTNGLLWEHKHEPQTKVSGRKLVPPPQPFRLYEVRGLFGALVTLQSPKLVNYPMYFEPGYEGTLWDWFHWIDDPNVNPKLHQSFTAQIELCCDTLKGINPFGDASNIILGQKIKLPGKYTSEGRITEIEISYDTDNDTGKHIMLKGVR